jgi:hypothetical protein
MSTWTILVVALWMAGGFPEPHTVVLTPGVECDPRVAKAVADRFAAESPHKDDYTGEFVFTCLDPGDAPGTEAPSPPAKKPHIPGPGEA